MLFKQKAFKFTFFHLALLTSMGLGGINASEVKANTYQEGNKQTRQFAPTSTKMASSATVNQLVNQNDHPGDSWLIANTEPGDSTEAAQNNSRFLRLLSLAFFILFFVPLGIFYPLFLFYRKILGVPDEEDYALVENSAELSESSSPNELGFKAEQENNKATVSTIQIAFAPPAGQLRHDLNNITSSQNRKEPDSGAEQDIVDLMRQVTSVLNAQAEHWTHVNCNSTSLPLEDIKPEFDLVLYREQNKLESKKLSFITRGESRNGGSQLDRYYNYVVVTMIFCTAHSEPLFEQVITKKQLVEELVKVSKMRRDYLIKFDILWNPQEEGKYISNDQLLVEYGEMLRLL